MGYMSMLAPCFVCGRLFASNPDYVPNLKGDPVCETCMELVNEKRAAAGMEPHFIHPQAYSPQEVA